MNRFDLERAYLNFRASLGERTSLRVTTDVYQQPTTSTDSYYRGWSIRAKYAYLQHDFLKGKDWSAHARFGMLNTVLIEHEESYWPRFLSQVAVERAGYFSSSDLGISAQLGLPRKIGEIVATVTNGPGYASREIDRFKDYAARVSFTPFARNGAQSTLSSRLTISAWGYKGSIASKFATPDPEQLAAIAEGLRRDRAGVFIGLRDRRMTLGAEHARRVDEGEQGANTAVSPRSLTDSTGQVTSAFVVLRPLLFARAATESPLGMVLRRERVVQNSRADRGYHVTIAGILWDLSKRSTVALDYQTQIPDDATAVALIKTLFVHFVAHF